MCGQAGFFQQWRALAGARTLCGGAHKARTPAYNNFALGPSSVDNPVVVPELRTGLSTKGLMIPRFHDRECDLVGRRDSEFHAKKSGTPFWECRTSRR